MYFASATINLFTLFNIFIMAQKAYKAAREEKKKKSAAKSKQKTEYQLQRDEARKQKHRRVKG